MIRVMIDRENARVDGSGLDQPLSPSCAARV